jgi:hypothetical protein
MVNSAKKRSVHNLSALPAGKHGKSKKRATKQRHKSNQGKTGFEAERVRALGALRVLRARKRKAAEDMAENKRELSEEEKQKWIDDYVHSETAKARERLAKAEEAVQEEMATDIGGLASLKRKQIFDEMLKAIGESIDDVVASDEDEDEDDDDDDDEEGEGEEDDDAISGEEDEPGAAIGTLPKAIEVRLQGFRMKRMKLDELTRPGWPDAAEYFRKRDEKYGVAESVIPTVDGLDSAGSQQLECLPDVIPVSDTDTTKATPLAHRELLVGGEKPLQQAISSSTAAAQPM